MAASRRTSGSVSTYIHVVKSLGVGAVVVRVEVDVGGDAAGADVGGCVGGC